MPSYCSGEAFVQLLKVKLSPNSVWKRQHEMFTQGSGLSHLSLFRLRREPLYCLLQLTVLFA